TDPSNRKFNRDTSAAAIAASAFYEILKYRENHEIRKALDGILLSLSEHYTNYNENVQGILMEQNGQRNYTIFGDYFIMEALCKKNYDYENIVVRMKDCLEIK